ncbi:MAG: BNR-repeat neuraminidase N-terminal domain-containing protein, partial [Bacteroidia bacterium]
NTVFINAVSTGTVFGTAALFHNDNFAPSSRLTLRNNILVNTSIASGSGKTVAYHRSGSTMGNFQLSSCRNLYYAGIPSANNVIFYDGTNADQTLSSYQTRVTPRDSVSFTENVSFVDTLGASSTFLKINPTIPTFVEATSTLDANVGIDFNNSSRAGFHGYSGTSGTPDLGAWEDNLTALPINNMYLDSLNAEQTAILAPRGTTNNIVIRIPVYTRKGASALVATSFKLNTIGTTNTADISDARIFYTGANPLFNDSNLFGSVNAPSGIFNVSGSQTLITGVNYFWLTYTISATATLNNFLDARLDSITLSGIQYAPINSSPNGVLTIQSRLNGSYNIGLGQAFSSITQALIELKQLGASGPVKFILKDTSYSNVTGENMPLVLGPYANASPTNKVTIMPDSGVNVVISGSSSSTTVDFNNCSHFYIDGRQGGMGGFTSGANLIIRNTDTTAPAIRFINDADSNQILYTDIRASNTSLMGFAGAGVVNFGTTDRTFGNDYNTIKLCHISGNDSLRSHVGISSIGSSSTIEAGNDNNIIDSCDIYNFSALDVGSVAGIYVGFNNSAWKIRNNRLYQTTGQYQNRGNSIYGVAIHSAYTNLTSRGGFIIHNNFIGGSDASGNGYFEINGVSSHQFHGISVSVGTGILTSIQGNTVANIKSTGSTLRGINLIRGNVNVGTIEGNTIGSRVNNGAIQGVVNSSNTNWIGISANGDPSDSFNIANNVINGFDIHGPLSYFVPAFTGIHLTGGNNVSIWNNLIGDTIPQNASIKISSGGNGLLGYTAQVVSGILMSPTSGTPHYNVSNNTVSNLFNYQSGLNSQVSLVTNGIKLLSSIGVSVIVNISHNLIASLYTTSLSTSALLGNSTAGVEIGSLGKCNVKNNIIRGLSISGNSPIARNWAINANLGAYNQNASINIIGNLIHTQMVWGNNPMNDIVGIQFSSSKSVVCNNMVRTGIDTLGNAIQAGAKLCGIYK